MGTILAIILLKQPTYTNSEVYWTEYDIPLPKVFHKVITEEEIGGRPMLIIGDVHGCLDELQELLKKAEACDGNTVIVFCGDIINKGPKNLETLKFVRSLDMYTVRGNHEEHVMKEWYKMKKAGTGKDLKQKYQWIQELDNDDMNYLLELPFTLSIPSLNSIVVHAGLDPWKPLWCQQPMNMTLMRNIIDPDGPSPRIYKYLDQGLPWASLWMGPQHVYFGHDAVRKRQIYAFATGLDTGCLYGGQLTGMYITSRAKRFITVKAAKVYREPKCNE